MIVSSTNLLSCPHALAYLQNHVIYLFIHSFVVTPASTHPNNTPFVLGQTSPYNHLASNLTTCQHLSSPFLHLSFTFASLLHLLSSPFHHFSSPSITTHHHTSHYSSHHLSSLFITFHYILPPFTTFHVHTSLYNNLASNLISSHHLCITFASPFHHLSITFASPFHHISPPFIAFHHLSMTCHHLSPSTKKTSSIRSIFIYPPINRHHYSLKKEIPPWITKISKVPSFT
jgi:hypothetical protein